MSDEQGSERPNKSALKREWQEKQNLVEQMTQLGQAELVRLGVEGHLLEAVRELAAMRPSGARNRQIKHCVNLIDSEVLAQIRVYLADRQSQRVAANQQFHRVERWRDRLVAEGDDALEEFLQGNTQIDRQHLRRLCRDAAREHKDGRPAGAGRKLFRYLKEVLTHQATD